MNPRCKMSGSLLALGLVLITFLLSACLPAANPTVPSAARGSTAASEEAAVKNGSSDPDPNASGDAPASAAIWGKPFDPSLLPNPKSQLLRLIRLCNYKATPLPKAIAMSSDGFGNATVLLETNTLEEAKRIAMNRCNALSGGKPCRLMVEGDRFVSSPGPETLMAKPSSLNDLPFTVKEQTWMNAIRNYEAATVFKAIAVSIDGGWSMYALDDMLDGTNIRISAQSQAEASRLALETCEARYYMSPCTLFAVGNEVVFDIKNMNWNMMLDFNRRSLAKPVPFFPDILYDRGWTPSFPNGQAANFLGVIYIGLDRSAYSIQAQTQNVPNPNQPAQDACTPLNGNIPCLKFIENGAMIWTSNFLAGKRVPEMHCTIMPRASCEAHRMAGCTTNGTYHVFSQGEMKETECRF